MHIPRIDELSPLLEERDIISERIQKISQMQVHQKFTERKKKLLDNYLDQLIEITMAIQDLGYGTNGLNALNFGKTSVLTVGIDIDKDNPDGQSEES